MSGLTEKQTKPVLGAGYQSKIHEVLFTFQGVPITRRRLVADLGSSSFVAARRVGKALTLRGVATARQLRGLPVHQLMRPGSGLGIEAGYILMALLHAHGEDPLAWVAGEKDDLVTLATIKRRAHARRR